MLTVSLGKSYYIQKCFLIDNVCSQHSFNDFIIDTGAPYTSCYYKCVNPMLREQNLVGSYKSSVFGGYVGGVGVVQYLYPVNHFYLGSLDLGKQEVWVTFDKRASANLLGMDLLQQLRFMQCENSKKLLIFRDDNDFIDYLISNVGMLNQCTSENKRYISDFILSNLENSNSDYLDLVYGLLGSIKSKVTDKSEIERMVSYLLK